MKMATLCIHFRLKQEQETIFLHSKMVIFLSQIIWKTKHY